jgi:hypothetical protein
MAALVRIFLLLGMIMVIRGFYRAWRVESARARERRRAAETGRFDNPSAQEVSDADFEEIP